MSEWDFSPRIYKPKPLTKAQLREMEKQFAEASKRLEKIKKLEWSQQEDIEHPEWI